MKLPSNFKDNIAKHFYDKEITLYATEDSVDEEGWAGVSETATQVKVMGNVNFNNLDAIREDYGIDERIDVTITVHEEIGLNTVVKYDDVLYKIVKAIPSDSHNLLVGTKWS